MILENLLETHPFFFSRSSSCSLALLTLPVPSLVKQASLDSFSRRHLYTALPTLTIAAHATILAMMNHSFLAHAAQLPRIGFHPVTTIALPEWTDQQAREVGHFTTFQFAMHVQHSTRAGIVTDTCLPIRAFSIRVLCLFLLSFPINTSHASLVRHSLRSRTWHEACWLLLFIHSLIESSSQTPSRRGLKPGGYPPSPPSSTLHQEPGPEFFSPLYKVPSFGPLHSHSHISP